MRSFVATISCLLGLAALAGATAADGGLPPAHEFKLAFERSGGFAPSTQSLTVVPGGRAEATSSGTRAGDRQAKFHLGGRRIRSLQRHLQQAHLGRIHAHGEETCADCYFYAIAYAGVHLELDQSQVTPRLGRVIGEIEAIIAAHTIPPNARS